MELPIPLHPLRRHRSPRSTRTDNTKPFALFDTSRGATERGMEPCREPNCPGVPEGEAWLRLPDTNLGCLVQVIARATNVNHSGWYSGARAREPGPSR